MTSVASVLAVLLAQQAAPPAPQQTQTPPVVRTQAPENQATAPPAETAPRPQLTAAPAPAASPAPTPPKPPRWDVNAPPGAAIRQVPIDVAEGSWMDVDVSPDGTRLAFALLGDIYVMPIAGGTPTRIGEGLAWEVHPRWSPDGRRIAFTSDRGGGDNIWVMNADGTDKRQVTKEDFRLLNQPSWSPDGRFLVAKKHFTTGRSLGTGEVWLYSIAGGAGVQLVKRASEVLQKELGEPIYAPDGSGVYYTRNITPGPIFEYAQDSNTDLFNIERYDLNTGEVTTVASGPGGSVRPTPSPDGRWLAFVRREATRSKLYLKDLQSGEERKLYDDLDQDVQETWAVTGLYPNMDWTPDSRSIVVWAGGKLRRVGLDGAVRDIPFRVRDSRGVLAAPHPVIPVSPDRMQTRMARFAAVSPDGTRVVYETLGRLWVKPAAGGTARRLTSGGGDMLELYPSWSRDGRTITFIGWTDRSLGQVMTVAASGGVPRAVTTRAGHYANPRFSPDARTIVFEARDPGALTAQRSAGTEGVYRVPAAGGAPALVLRDAREPQFTAAADRLFMVDNEGGKLELISTDLSGGQKRVHARGELVTDYQVAPDGTAVAFRQNFDAYAMPLMPGGQAVEVARDAKALPVVKVSGDGATFIHWSGDGRLHWTLGATLYTVDRARLFPAAPPPESAPKFVAPTSGTSLAMDLPADRPTGTTAITGARVLTMPAAGAATDAGAIDDAVIVIRGDRIVAVGPRATTPIPTGARTVDATGKTIIPGLVDAHAHGPQGENELVPQQNWSAITALALGTTTIHDPSSQATAIFAAAERQRAGTLLAPRIFSTGEIIYGAKSPTNYAQIDSLEDATAHVRRLKAQGAYSVKNYNQPRREQRQQVVAASRAENMLVVAEGGSLYGMDMTLVADGNSTLEHNIPLDRFYDDILQFMGQARTNYTPTLVVSYGGLAGDPWWRQATDVFEQPLLNAHMPPGVLRAQTARRTKAPEGDFVDDDNAREAKRLADRGVLVSIGAHGQQAGIAAHWELWSFVRGGMTPAQALRAGTITAAQSLGMAADIGSLEAGKLADLVILDADPSQDIRNSERVAKVMLGGRLYDARTMREEVTGTGGRQPYWWE